MKAYRLSVKLKLGLIVFAMFIAVASLWYTHRLVDRLREREQTIIQLWADAQAQVAQSQQRSLNPYRSELERLREWLGRVELGTGRGASGGLSREEINDFQQAVAWAESMPPTGELNFILDEILEPNPFGVPAIITDSTFEQPLFWRNVGVPESLSGLPSEDSVEAIERLKERRAEMDASYDPIPIELRFPGASDTTSTELRQYVHYDESSLVRELRIFPYVQLLFVGLFILVGYLGFSYVRRSEQSSLWVGMAREAAHQLGTPISSLMGWIEVLRMDDLSGEQQNEAISEIENDVERLQRVANRFSDIGSMPKLKVQDVHSIVENTTDYIRRRIPREGQQVTLNVDVPEGLTAPVNEELFGWVIENLLKNALDAIEDSEGMIDVKGFRQNGQVCIEVRDTGSGIDRREWKNIFRPGFSTKQRGWGLGLSLAQRVIENYHGGDLSLVESTVGEGSTFRIELPAENGEA